MSIVRRGVLVAVLLGVSLGVVGISLATPCDYGDCVFTGYAYTSYFSYHQCYRYLGVDYCGSYDPTYATCKETDKFSVYNCLEGECWVYVSTTTICLL